MTLGSPTAIPLYRRWRHSSKTFEVERSPRRFRTDGGCGAVTFRSTWRRRTAGPSGSRPVRTRRRKPTTTGTRSRVNRITTGSSSDSARYSERSPPSLSGNTHRATPAELTGPFLHRRREVSTVNRPDVAGMFEEAPRVRTGPAGADARIRFRLSLPPTTHRQRLIRII